MLRVLQLYLPTPPLLSELTYGVALSLLPPGTLYPSVRNPPGSYNHFLVNHGSVLLKDTVWLLFLQDQPFNSPTQDLRVDGDEVDRQREDLDYEGCQPGGGSYMDNTYEPIGFGKQRLTSSLTNEQ